MIELGFLHSIAAATYVAIGIICTIVGSNRGDHAKRANSHIIFYFICFMILWYVAANVIPFGLAVDRNDGLHFIPLLRFFCGFTIIFVFTTLTVYVIKEDSLNLVLHFIISAASVSLLFFGAFSYDLGARRLWTVAAVVFIVILFSHVIKESNRERMASPRFISSIILFSMIYTIVFFVTTVCGPLHENVMSFYAQELIMSITDLIISGTYSIFIVHYSWAIGPQSRKIISPGDLTKVYEQFKLNRLQQQQNTVLSNLSLRNVGGISSEGSSNSNIHHHKTPDEFITFLNNQRFFVN